MNNADHDDRLELVRTYVDFWYVFPNIYQNINHALIFWKR